MDKRNTTRLIPEIPLPLKTLHDNGSIEYILHMN